MVHATEISPDIHIPLRRPTTSNNSSPKCSGALCTTKCSLLQGTILSQVLKSKKSTLRETRAAEGTPVEMIQELHSTPLSTNLLSGFLSGSSTANLRPLLVVGQIQGCATVVWEQRTWGRVGEKPDQELTPERCRLVGKTKCWQGFVLFCLSIFFLCVQGKVTRCMIYLAQRKQLFGGSAGVFR